VPGGQGGLELERTLALKVSEVLPELQRAGPAAPSGEALRALPPAGPNPAAISGEARPAVPPERRVPAADSGEPSRAPLAWGGFSSAGPRLAAALGPGQLRWGVAAELGPSLSSATLSARVRLGVTLFPATTLERAGSEVKVSELAPLLGGALYWTRPDFALGLRAAAALSLLQASGRSAAAERGESSAQSFSGSVGIALERNLSGGLALAASLDLQLFALRHRFDIGRETIADLGRAQLQFGIDLLFRTQLSAPVR
jgi:hypothetical protein